MNERIRELAEQAEIKFEAHLQHAWIDTAVITPADLKKFAKLIIRECVDKIESKRSSGENTDQWTITRDMCYHDMMRELKEHFGLDK